jgi:cardiolipin synthase
MNTFLPGNRLRLLRNGTEYFSALETAINQATQQVDLETYIFEEDTTGRRIANCLVAAAHRGVKVHLLVDGFGSYNLRREFVASLRSAGVEILRYRPEISPLVLRRYRLRRLHRKIAVIDHKIAFVGGINIRDDEEVDEKKIPHLDFAVVVEGPLVDEINFIVKRLWRMVRWTRFKHRDKKTDSLMPAHRFEENQLAEFVIRDNLHHRKDIEQAYLSAINEAQHEIILANAYFLPGIQFKSALFKAAARGVRVVLLLQGKPEYLFVYYATHALYRSLLDANIEIFNYHQSILHAKVAVIDGEWATVGSSNIDPFSLFLSREANVFVKDKKFAGELKDALMEAIANGSVQVKRDGFEKESWVVKALTWISYNLVRFLSGMVGYAKYMSK